MEEDRLSRNEWKLLEKINKTLESFKIATLATEGTDATLTKVLLLIDFFLNAYDQALQQHRDDEILIHIIHIGKSPLKKYFNASDLSPIYLATVVINPRFKWRYFELKCKRTWISQAKKRLCEYWILWKENLVSSLFHTTKTKSNFIPNRPTVTESIGNNFTAWIDIGDPTQDEYDQYCANPEPEISCPNV